MTSDNILFLVLEWLWVALFGIVTWFARKLFVLETRVSVVEAVMQEERKSRRRDEERRNEQRREMLEAIHQHQRQLEAHNGNVTERLERIDEYIRNQSA